MIAIPFLLLGVLSFTVTLVIVELVTEGRKFQDEERVLKALGGLGSGVPDEEDILRDQALQEDAVSSQICSRYEAIGLYEQAEVDFARYSYGMTAAEEAEYLSFCENHSKYACMTVVILGGRIYVRHFYGGYQSRHRSTLHALYRVQQRFGPLPDAQFVIEVTDGNFYMFDLPIFVITRPEQSRAGVLYPDFTFYSWPEAVCPPERSHAYGFLYDQYVKEAEAAEANPERAWSLKKDELFWRGGVVGNPQRSQAVQAVQGQPGVDVAFMQWTNVTITGKNGAPGCVGLLDHCKYRYLAFLNGNTYSSRLKYQLLCGSCVFASQPSWIEWWSSLFAPGRDYVEVQPDWRDAIAKLAAVRSNPAVGREIAERSRRKALAVLSEDAVDCYWLRLIHRASTTLPRPSFVDAGDLPPSTRPIEDVLLYPNGASLGENSAEGIIEPVR